MRVLVTDASGGLGRLVTRQLVAAGHTVSGIAQRPHTRLDPGVEFVCAPLRHPVLQDLADQADAVIHLAPVDPTAPGHADLDGLAHVADVAARAGARLLFVSHAAGRPDLCRPAEELVSGGWAPSLVVRIAPPVGRQLDWMVCRTVATLLRTNVARVSTQPIRILHLEDLVRFLVSAVNTDRTGVVDLATPDTVNVITAWRLLRSVDPRSRLHHVRGWPQLVPEMDLTALQEDWTFAFGWQAVDAMADTARGLIGRRIGEAGATGHGTHLALPVEVLPRPRLPDGLPSAAPDGLEGEFDDRIDPRFPVFSANGLAEALPGPLTPLTLDVQLGGLRRAGRAVGQVLASDGGPKGMRQEWGSRAFAVFGHRAYVGVSANAAAAAQLPGWDAPHEGEAPTGKGAGSIAKGVVAARSLALLRHLRADTRAYVAAAESEHLDAAQLASLPDAGLEVRLRLLRDRIHQGWVLTALWLIDTGVTAAVVERHRAGAGVSGLGMIVESGRVREETAELIAALRGDPPLCALARQGNLASIRALSPDTAAVLDSAIARVGHRGTGDAELAGRVFGDDPSALLTMAAELAELPADPVEEPPPTLAGRLAGHARASRELAHDTMLRFTHELRMALRELASRRVAGDAIDAVEDVYYLTCDELVTMPADARLRIKRRRAERERLQAQRPPDVIDGSWIPVQHGD